MIQEKAFDKIQNPFIIQKKKKTLGKIEIEESFSFDTENLQKATANIIFNGEELNAFLLKWEIRQECLFSPLVLNIVLETKGRQIGNKEEKPSGFVDDMIAYVENLRNLLKKNVSPARSQGSRAIVIGYTRNTQNSIILLYTDNKKTKFKR